MGTGAVRGTSCESCSNGFSITNRKKMCSDCRMMYCSGCLVKDVGRVNNHRRCHNCRLFAAGNFKRNELMGLKVRDLRRYLTQKNVPTHMCREKHDLVDMILNMTSESYRREQEEHNVMVEEIARRHRQMDSEDSATSSENTANNRSSSANITTENASNNSANDNDFRNNRTDDIPMSETENGESGVTTQVTVEEVAPPDGENENDTFTGEGDNNQYSSEEKSDKKEPIVPKGNRASLSDLKCEEDLSRLSVRQLKEILACNFVDFKGCVERSELQERVHRLFLTDLENKQKLQEANEKACDPEASDETRKDLDDNLCKICMDATIDCVLLECGHMVTCSKCGKVLSECPICRQYVVRAVHVFKA